MEEEKKLSNIIIEAMQIKNLNLEKLAQVSNISERFLEPLLRDEFEKLPASPYLHGYILKIAHILHLNGDELWELFLKNNEHLHKSGEKDKFPKIRFQKIKLNKKIIIGGGIGIIIFIYLIFKIQTYFSLPSLEIKNLNENTIVESSPFILEGKTDPKNQLFLNGEQLYSNENGEFEKIIELQPGFNALSFKIKKFLGKEYVIEKQIYLRTEKINQEKSLEKNNKTSENQPTTEEQKSSTTETQ